MPEGSEIDLDDPDETSGESEPAGREAIRNMRNRIKALEAEKAERDKALAEAAERADAAEDRLLLRQKFGNLTDLEEDALLYASRKAAEKEASADGNDQA